MTREVMQQALEALESGLAFDAHSTVLQNLRKALAQPVQEPMAKAWNDGYKAGVADERTSEANIGIAGFGAKIKPARQNPYGVAQPMQEPSQWREMVVVTLVREGIDKHRARELADHFAAQPEQQDSCFCHDGVSLQIVSGGAAPEGYLGKVTLLIDGKYVDYVKAQRKPLTDDVLVPLEVLEAAASSLDSFCGDLGWGDADR